MWVALSNSLLLQDIEDNSLLLMAAGKFLVMVGGWLLCLWIYNGVVLGLMFGI